MSAATPSAQTAASPAMDPSVPPYGEAVKLALSLGGGIVGTFALVYYGTTIDFKPPFLAFAAAAAYTAAIRRRFGGLAAWSAALFLHLGLLYTGALRPGALLALVALGVGAPVLAFWLCRALRWQSSFFALAVLACLMADLWRYAGSASPLYEGQPSPARRGVDVSLGPPRWPMSRSPAPPEWISEDAQALRYPELVERKGVAFSVPMPRERYRRQTLKQDEDSARLSAPLSFDAALKSKRWAAYLLGKDYFRLIHSRLPPDIIRSFLAVGEPLFQFKDGAIVVPDSGLARFFADLPPGAASDLLRCYAILSEAGGASWDSLRVAPKAALARSRACRPAPFRLSISGQTDDELEADYDAARAGALYWSDGYDERWHAFIDGREVPIVRAGAAFKALPLRAGSHRLRLDYEPRSFQIGLLLHFATIAACLIAALATSWSSRASRSR